MSLSTITNSVNCDLLSESDKIESLFKILDENLNDNNITTSDDQNDSYSKVLNTCEENLELFDENDNPNLKQKHCVRISESKTITRQTISDTQTKVDETQSLCGSDLEYDETYLNIFYYFFLFCKYTF